MVEIVFRSGETELKVDAAEQDSIMRTALQAGVEGIVGECGGELSCATCHVYIDDSWSARLRPPALAEREMLEVLDSVTPRSRLSCQIFVTPELDGLLVEIAPQF